MGQGGAAWCRRPDRRRVPGDAARGVALNSFEIPVPDDRLDLDLCLRSGQVFRWRKLEHGDWQGADGAKWYRFTPIAAGLQPAKQIEVASNATVEETYRFFRLDSNAQDVEAEILKRGPELAPAIEQLKGIRLMRHSDPIETIFCFLCSANNNLHRIIPMCWKLGQYGVEIAPNLHSFPKPEQIAEIPESELRQLGFGYRGATIPKVAQEICTRGGKWMDNLKAATYTDAHAELCTLPGIGPKLADCICLYGLDHGEAVPLDTHIWQAFTRLYHPEWRGKAVTDFRYKESTQRFRDRFGDLSGWAHLFLFYENLLNARERRSTSV